MKNNKKIYGCLLLWCDFLFSFPFFVVLDSWICWLDGKFFIYVVVKISRTEKCTTRKGKIKDTFDFIQLYP